MEQKHFPGSHRKKIIHKKHGIENVLNSNVIKVLGAIFLLIGVYSVVSLSNLPDALTFINPPFLIVIPEAATHLPPAFDGRRPGREGLTGVVQRMADRELDGRDGQ